MLGDRWCFTGFVLMHLVAPEWAVCQDLVNVVLTDRFAPPAVIPISVPPDKPAHRKMAGCERLGMVYTHDVAQSNSDVLKVFETIQEFQDAGKRDTAFIWMLQMGTIKDGFTYPIAGGLYRWHGPQSQFNRVDSGAI